MFSTRNCYSSYSAGLYIQSVPENVCVLLTFIILVTVQIVRQYVIMQLSDRVLLNTDAQLYRILLTLEQP